jgi:hypothetical protein
MSGEFPFKTPALTFPQIRNPLLEKERLNPAQWMYERLVKQIIVFERNLSPEEEIGGRFVTAPRDGAIHIADIGYWNPDMIIFYGEDADGRKIELLQHHSQVSVLLCAMPKEKDKPRRIGFILEQRLKE